VAAAGPVPVAKSLLKAQTFAVLPGRSVTVATPRPPEGLAGWQCLVLDAIGDPIGGLPPEERESR
jgi:hypothetical protein